MGPTAAGKSALAMRLAAELAARGQAVEIISVDSAQVYRGMDIGTAKPDSAERGEVPHHLIDICDPSEAYSAARFAADARRLISEIRARGRLPLLVGGTMLYFRALTHGFNELPSADGPLRAQLGAEAAVLGWPAMHQRLAVLDPITAARLHPNDRQRVQRALEVIHSSGRPLSELQGAVLPGHPPLVVARLAVMPPDRANLHARIEARLRQMLAGGLVEEVMALHRRGDLHAGLPAIRAVGYQQFWRHLDGEYSRTEAEARALYATRQLAKRQVTWLRSEHDPCWLNPEAPETVVRALGCIGV